MRKDLVESILSRGIIKMLRDNWNTFNIAGDKTLDDLPEFFGGRVTPAEVHDLMKEIIAGGRVLVAVSS